ncbi:MAG: phosphoadenylyl-sulfate reductase [Acidobacteria bacterium]|nr:phosphoadenylyl-sulfate reductase [Acidobacteriota bacterium]
MDFATFQKEKEKLPTIELLRWAIEEYGDRVALASSFGAEDMVLLDLLTRISPRPRVFTLDTGRLPKETYQLMEEVEKRYGLPLEIHFPKAEKVEEMVQKEGINLFYKSVELRRLCCHVRKVEPLQRALAGLDAWVSGLRREQSLTRTSIFKVEQDGNRIKINPLVEWTEAEVWDYIRKNQVPYNRLHDQNYPSIGCAPCTRAIVPGEDPRAGRWWWELETHKECGLHMRKPSILPD